MPTEDRPSSDETPSDISPLTNSLQLRKELMQLRREADHWRKLSNQADERLHLAMDVGCLGIWEWNIAENRITREGYHEELFGLTPGTFSGTYEEFLACVHPEDRERVQAEIDRSLAFREDYQQEYRVVWPDGTIRWMEGRARLECDTHGRPVRMLGVVQDVTDRKQIEEQQRRFRALFEAAQDAVLIADDDRRYVEANPAAGQLLGLPPAELVGRLVQEFVLDVHGTDVDSSWQQFRTTGAQTGECRLRRADGTECHAEFSAATDFLPGLHLSILRDITERKRAEEALARQASELARSNADLQQFAYVTSHDLREPLRGMISFSQLLAQRYRAQLDEEADRCLEYIVSGAYRMKGLIDSLLTYSRVINVEMIPFARVPLDSAVHWASMNLQTLIEETRASVTHDELPTVIADHVQLVQLFQNLISNAIKYRQPQSPPQIHVSAELTPEHCLVSVRDNGIGIDPKYAERIFGVFKRLHGSEIPGTGIGLAICKRIVQKHGGNIWVESKPGEGATFRFTLPCTATK
jgi:PAS domain S-box-containing protein